MKLLLIFCCYFLLMSGAAEAMSETSSFIINCRDRLNPNHLRPLAFYEFEGAVGKLQLLENPVNLILRIAPLRFSALEKALNSPQIERARLPHATVSDADTTEVLPGLCLLERIATQNLKTGLISVHKDLWDQLPKKVQSYVLFELVARRELKDGLAVLDYRRFIFYVYSGLFDKLSIDQKIFFLTHHGIGELNVGGISLDIFREIQFFESGRVKHAFPYPKASFKGAPLYRDRYVTFFETGELRALATKTPFNHRVRGQEFKIYVPESILPTLGSEEGMEPRIEFYKNGEVSYGWAVPFTNFFGIVTNIKDSFFNRSYKAEYFRVGFFENGAPKTLTSYPGEFYFQGKTRKVFSINFWKENIVHELSFDKPEVIKVKGKDVEVRILGFDFEGQPQSVIL